MNAVSRIVLDSSAILAVIHREPGADVVLRSMPNAVASTVNIAEVVTRLSDTKMPEDDILSVIGDLRLDAVGFDDAQAFAAGLLRRVTRHIGLSLGDRACLALADRMGLPVLTADRPWAQLDIGVEVRLIR